MSRKKRKVFLLVWLSLIVICILGALLSGSQEKHETIKEMMKDAVLHESNKIDLFGVTEVNPAVAAAFTVTGILLVLALAVRIFAVPKFKIVPGKLQMLLEQLVGFFEGLGKTNSPHRHKFLNVYIFSAGVYIFFSTVFELFGVQATSTHGAVIALPAPLSDINAAIAMGCMSYLVIMSGGIASNGIKGIGKTLKDFSLPISMSFRLFGAMLSGLLVTEMVYYYVGLSFALPVVVAVLFTLLHALIQTYVLTMLTSVFYGESAEKSEKKIKNKH
ncbi:MAG: hypothetical protein E7623_06415 [Ruminococcaceae bacterium]|nr:hypothetical protein [Oscillospiraceae bacterium]